MGTEVGVFQALVGLVPNLFRGVGAEQGIDPESAAKFEVSPVVKWVPDGLGDGFGPGLEFFTGWGLAGDVGLGNSVGPHGPPLVVVFPQPEIGDVVPALVLGHFPGRQMGVIVDDGQGGGCPVEESLGCFTVEEETVVEKGPCHGFEAREVIRGEQVPRTVGGTIEAEKGC